MTDYTPATPRNLGDHDAPHLSPVSPADDARTVLINNVSWGAVFAGVVAALAIQLVLNLLGIGIGASTLEPGTGDNPSAMALSAGAGAWWAASGIIAAFLGGYIASRLSGRPKESTGGWHGLIAWAATTLVVFYLLTTAIGGIIGGAFSAVGGALGGLGQTAATAAQTAAPTLATTPDPFAQIEQSLRSATGEDPAALRDASVSAVRAVVTGDPSQAADARERAAQTLAKAQNIPVEEARSRVSEYENRYRQSVEQAKQSAIRAAEVTVKAVTRGSLLASIALLLGAFAAYFGGRAGTVDPTVSGGIFVINRRPKD